MGRTAVKIVKADTGIEYRCFTITDITEEEHLKTLLLEKERELQNVLDFSRDLITIIDQTSKRIYISNSATQIYGYTPEELIGKSGIDLVYEEDKELSKKVLSQLFTAESIKYFENRIVRKDGNVINMSWSFNLDKERKHAYIIGRDITEKIKFEKELKESEKNYSSLVENLKTGILKQGVNSEILFSNPAALEMLGITQDQARGRTSFHPDWNVIHENGDDFPAPTHPVVVAVATQKSVNDVVMGVYRPLLNDRLWLLVNAEPAFTATGQLDHVTVTFNDITLQIKAREQLRKNEKQLITKNIELERFAYIASHDLQEPLRMVSSFMKLIEKKYTDIIDDAGKKYIHFAVDGAERMKVLIDDLLRYSQVSERSAELEKVDMNKIMSTVLSNFNNENYRADADITIEDLPVINAGKTAMSQLMQNLLGNALKYKGAVKPIVIVSAKEDAIAWTFSVKDNGIGIDPKNAEKVFEMFHRLVTKQKYVGTSIGLATCKKIVESFGGTIWVKSELGAGADFKFSIPKK
jgi:PAS domain S-box-containing protein